MDFRSCADCSVKTVLNSKRAKNRSKMSLVVICDGRQRSWVQNWDERNQIKVLE